MTVIAYISLYLLIGVMFSFIMDTLVNHYSNGFHFSEDTSFTNKEKIYNTLLWPLALWVFMKGVLGYYDNNEEDYEIIDKLPSEEELEE